MHTALGDGCENIVYMTICSRGVAKGFGSVMPYLLLLGCIIDVAETIVHQGGQANESTDNQRVAMQRAICFFCRIQLRGILASTLASGLSTSTSLVSARNMEFFGSAERVNEYPQPLDRQT